MMSNFDYQVPHNIVLEECFKICNATFFCYSLENVQTQHTKHDNGDKKQIYFHIKINPEHYKKSHKNNNSNKPASSKKCNSIIYSCMQKTRYYS